MGNFSFKLDEQKINKLKETFKDYLKDNSNEYLEAFIQKDDLTISIYKSHKAVFQGNDAFYYAQSFIETKKIRQAGSDEVGTGDCFGPVVVCSAIVELTDYEYLEQNNVTDSKALNDEYIKKIGPELMKRFKHSLLILNNETYNRVHETNNLNAIKAKMHNQAYLNMLKKGYDIPNAAYVDQFCSEDDYYRYLQNEKEIYRPLIFETKAESKYKAVAIGSIIARYAFLDYMEKLNKKYQINFHLGSSDSENILKDCELFVEKYGKERLNEVCKLHFKTFEKYRLIGEEK